MRTTIGYPASGHVDAAVSFAFDHASAGPLNSSLTGTTPLSWTHTPVGIPKGVLVLAATENSAVSRVTGTVTYGSATLTALSPSPFLTTVGVQNGCVAEGWFLGSSVPTGAQTVALPIDTGGYGSINACAVTVVGPNNSAVEDTSTVQATGTNPTCALTIANQSLAVGVVMSNLATAGAVVVGAGITQIATVDVGAQQMNFAYRTALVSSNSSVDWTAASAEYGILVASIKST